MTMKTEKKINHLHQMEIDVARGIRAKADHPRKGLYTALFFIGVIIVDLIVFWHQSVQGE